MRSRIVTACGLALSIAGAAMAQPTPVLMVESAGLNAWLPDAKDQGLRRALAMLPARVRELPGQAPDFPPVAARIANLGASAVTGPMRFALVHDDTDPAAGGFGYGAWLSLSAKDQEQAAEMHALVNGAIAQAPNFPFVPMASKARPGMSQMQTPVALVTYGPTQVKGSWFYDVMAGASANIPATFASWSAPADLTPLFRMRIDSAGLAPLLEMAPTMVGPDDAEVTRIVDAVNQSGLIGKDGLSLDLVAGHTKDAAVCRVTLGNAQALSAHVPMPKEALTPAELRVIPSDAFAAFAHRAHFGLIGKAIDAAAAQGQPVNEQLAEFENRTGVNLRTDVLEALGGSVIGYMSDSTGGSSILSGVLLVGVTDHERLASASTKLMAAANLLASAVPTEGGAIRLVRWSHDGDEIVTLRFQGLPIPLELSYAVTKSWLILGPTPQAVIAASRQARGAGDKGILSNPAFAGVASKSDNCVALAFLDTTRGIRVGYPAVSLLGSAISNAMRSPIDDPRDPGLIVPLYHDLAKAAKPMVLTETWSGDDLVFQLTGDRSMLVNASGLLGMLTNLAPLAIPAAAGQNGGNILGAANPGDLLQEWMFPGWKPKDLVSLTPSGPGQPR